MRRLYRMSIIAVITLLLGFSTAYAVMEESIVTFYQEDACAEGKVWEVSTGAYTQRADEPYRDLPFRNDEVSSVAIPKGLSVYLTDGKNFDPEDNQVLWFAATDRDIDCVSIGRKGGLMGKASSAAVWLNEETPTPEIVLLPRPSLLPEEFSAIKNDMGLAIFYSTATCQKTDGEHWAVSVGQYTRGNERYEELPFPNNSVQSVSLSKGLAVYLTDGRYFDPDDNETALLYAEHDDLVCEPVGSEDGLAGEVSSAALWAPALMPTPWVVLSALGPKVTVYDEVDCNSDAKSWEVGLGLFTKKGEFPYRQLPFRNDKITSLDLPKGFSVYMTDGLDFDPEANQAIKYEAVDERRSCVPIGREDGLMDHVSSIAVWAHTVQPTPEVAAEVPRTLFPEEIQELKDTLVKVTFYRDASCGQEEADGAWTVPVGLYTAGNQRYEELPFPNDRIQSLKKPEGIAVYLTDGHYFTANGTETALIPASEDDSSCVVLGDELAGNVSSAAIWAPQYQTTPVEVP
ncbi:MAG: hypothetical protein GY801_19760 [bacterium]|nr:hypothetical protein [bacterium]